MTDLPHPEPRPDLGPEAGDDPARPEAKPRLCPACAEELPAGARERCPLCGERLGVHRHRSLPPLALRRVSVPGSLGLGAFGPVALLLAAFAAAEGHPGLLLVALLFGAAAAASAVVVKRNLTAPRQQGGVPVVLGLFLGGALLVALFTCLVFGVDSLHHHPPRRQGNEGSAIGALKTISTAQALFREADKENDGNLDYGTLRELGGAGNMGLIDSVLASGTKRGYLFEAHYGLRTSEFIWYATATPVLPGTTGDRYFATNQEGVIFYTTSGAFPFNPHDCTLPTGAVPVGR